MATSKKKKPRAGKAAARRLILLDVRRVFEALHNARAQLRTLGTPYDEINNATIGQLTETMNYLANRAHTEGAKCR